MPRLVRLRAAAASGPAACRVADGPVACCADPRCADATVLTFTGTPGNGVGTQGPFLFTNDWVYDAAVASEPGQLYPQAIDQLPTSNNLIFVVPDSGVSICRYMLHAPLG